MFSARMYKIVAELIKRSRLFYTVRCGSGSVGCFLHWLGGDSLITLAAMNRQEDDNDIRAFLQAFSQPKFNHVRREANQVARRLLLVQELGGNRKCLGSRNHRI